MKILNSIITIFFSILAVTVIGCSNFGSIKEETLYLNFPIKLSLSQKINTWQIIVPHEPYFDLYISNISKIIFNDLSLEGNFKIMVRYSDEVKTNKSYDDYFFYQIYIECNDSIYQQIRDKILQQELVLYNFNCSDSYEEWVDTKNNVLIVMNNKDKTYTFIDMAKFYAEPKMRFPQDYFN